MIVGPEVAGVIIVAAALWVALGVLIAILAARRLRRAQAVLGAARTMRSLLDAAPARAMLVHADGRIEADGKLLRELGFASALERLGQLTGDEVGFDSEDLAASREFLLRRIENVMQLGRVIGRIKKAS